MNHLVRLTLCVIPAKAGTYPETVSLPNGPLRLDPGLRLDDSACEMNHPLTTETTHG